MAERTITPLMRATLPPEAIAQLERLLDERAKAEKEQPGVIETIGRGLAQGITWGGMDELSGIVASILGGGAEELGKILATHDPSTYQTMQAQKQVDLGGVKERYELGREAAREADIKAEEANPKTFVAAQIGGGVLGGGAAGGAKSVGGRILRGGVEGAVEGALSSEEEGADRIADALLGATTGVAGAGLAEGARGAYRKLRGAKRTAQEMASEVDPKAISAIGKPEPVEATLAKGEALEKTTGVPLTPGQATGDPGLLGVESAERQIGKRRREAVEFQRKQRDEATSWIHGELDARFGRSKSGRTATGKGTIEALQEYDKELAERASKEAGPIYRKAAKVAGNFYLFDVDPIEKQARKLLREKSESAVAPKFKATLGRLRRLTRNGKANYAHMKSMREYWGGIARGDEVVSKKLSPAANKRLGILMRDSVDAAFEKSAADLGKSGGPAEKAYKLLLRANKTYAKYTKPRDELNLHAVRATLGMEKTATLDKVALKLADSSEGQVGEVFSALNKADRSMANGLRRQMVEDVLAEHGGLATSARPVSAELGVRELNPGAALAALHKREPALLASFKGGPPGARMTYKTILALLQRLSASPRWEGAQTAPVSAIAMERFVRERGSNASLSMSALSIIKGLLSDKETRSQVLANYEYMRDFRKALRLTVSGKEPAAEKVLNGLRGALVQAGQEAREGLEENDAELR